MATAKCGDCIYSGFKSCIFSPTDRPLWTVPYLGTDNTKSRCCLNTDECRETYATWTCSSAYNNTVYSKYVCPYVPSQCGVGKDSITLADVNAKDTLTVNLA